MPHSDVILIAVVAGKYFQNHHERAVCILRETHYLSGRIEVTRFNRRLHKLAQWLAFIATTLGEIFLVLPTGVLLVTRALLRLRRLLVDCLQRIKPAAVDTQRRTLHKGRVG